MRALGLAAVVTALLAAGCVVPTLPDADALPAPRFGAPVAVSREWPGSEPVVAVASDGTLFIEGVGAYARPGSPRASNVNKVYRSVDDGATWTDVTPPGVGQEASFDGYLAIGNGDRVYAVNVFAVTFQIYRSDDLGDSWRLLPTPRDPPLVHRNWVLPRGEADLLVAYETLPPSYAHDALAGARTEGMWFLRSADRGETWSTPVRIDPRVNYAGQSNMAASPDGESLYVMRYEEDGVANPLDYSYAGGRFYLVASENGGATWERREAIPLESEIASALTSLVLDPAGSLHFVWSAESGGVSRVHTATSADGGRTWTAPAPLASPGSRGAQAMPFAEARGPGALGILWYATEAEGTASAVDAPWHVDYASVDGLGGGSPAVATTRVAVDPVHRGNVCAKGPACGPGEDRRLLDYPWIVFGPDGRAHLAFASTEWDRSSAFPVYAGEIPGGPGLAAS